MGMEITERTESGSVTVLSLTGAVMGGPDAAALNDRLHGLVDGGKRKVVLDLSGVSYLNSSGLGILIGGLTTMRNNGGDLRLAAANERVDQLLTVTRLSQVFGAHPTVDAAVASYTA